MELVMKRPIRFFETLQKLIPQKGGNIVYEEKAHGKCENYNDILDDILAECGNPNRTSELIIIDRYFTQIDCACADEVARRLFEWKEKHQIDQIIIWTKERKNCFEEKIRKEVSICKIKDSIHDRFWIFKNGNMCKVVSVGASFNGFIENTKHVFYITSVKECDVENLLKILYEHGIKIL